MPDRLEERLRALAPEVEFPPTPELAAAVLPRLAERPARRPLFAPAHRSLALAAVALAVLAAAAAAVPPIRDAVGDLLGLRGATVQRVPRLPASPGRVDLGRSVPLATAARRAGFEIRLPADRALGRPDGAYVRGRPPLAQLTLIYRPRSGLRRIAAGPVGLLLTQFRGDLDPDLIAKLVGPGARVRRLSVGSSPALWIEGPHSFVYRDARGRVRDEARRLATNTLLWSRGPVLLRLEADVSLRRALEIARSVR